MQRIELKAESKKTPLREEKQIISKNDLEFVKINLHLENITRYCYQLFQEPFPNKINQLCNDEKAREQLISCKISWHESHPLLRLALLSYVDWTIKEAEIIKRFLLNKPDKLKKYPAALLFTLKVNLHFKHNDLSEVRSLIQKAKPEEICHLNLRKATLDFLDLSEANMSGVNLKEAQIAYAIFKKANLSKTILTDAIFIQSDLSNADLSNSNATRVKFEDSTLVQVNLKNTKLNSATFLGCDLRKVHLDIFGVSAILTYIRLLKPKQISEWGQSFLSYRQTELSIGVMTSGENTLFRRPGLFSSDFAFLHMLRANNKEDAESILAEYEIRHPLDYEKLWVDLKAQPSSCVIL